MTQDRRSFIRRFGAALGSLIVSGSLSGCGPRSDVEEKTKDEGKPQDKPLSNTASFSAPEWKELRQCWFNLGDPAVRNALSNRFRRSAGKSEDSAITEDVFVKQHRAILDSLVARGQLEKSVAELIQTALEEAVVHIVYSASLCYDATPMDYEFRRDLLQQADMLQRISGDLDPATVAKASAAIVKDVAFFERFSDFNRNRARPLAEDREASPEAVEAARVLTQLFAENRD